MNLNLHDKALYHQIHPVKLATDWSTGLVAIYLLWQHRLAPGAHRGPAAFGRRERRLAAMADLEPYRRSAFGRYIATSMTPAMQAMRGAGYAVMAFGVWRHMRWMMAVGFATIIFGWLRGMSFGKRVGESR